MSGKLGEGLAGKLATGLVFLHGSGDDGNGIRSWLHMSSGGCWAKFASDANMKIVYPDAPVVPYTLAGGYPQSVWFDRSALAYNAPEDRAGIDRSIAEIDAEIDQLVQEGIPVDRIGVAGFSMGGCMAMHVGYGSGKYAGKLAFVASLSSYLAENSNVDELASSRAKECSPPLYMAHGSEDRMINPAWAEATRKRLAAAGVDTPTSISIYRAGHELCQPEIEELVGWMLERLQ